MSKVVTAGLVAALAALVLPGASAQANEDGEKAFKKYCTACHTVENGKNKIGPSLSGIVGRKAGSVAGFAYSASNKASSLVWNEKVLDEYLVDPKKFMPGTKMVFAGVKKADERSALISYLKTAK